jgi:hypothetical protein
MNASGMRERCIGSGASALGVSGVGGDIERMDAGLSKWAAVATNRPKTSWRERAELAAVFIRPGERVCDLGAGARPLKDCLPSETVYFAVDCIDELPGTHLADFNQSNFTLPPGPIDVITALGVLNYIEDLDAFFSRLTKLAPGAFIIFTYDFWPLTKRFRAMGNLSGIGEMNEGIALFSRHVRDLVPVTVTRRRAMFTGVLGPNSEPALVKLSATKLICRRLRPLEYIALKFFGVHMMPKWLA